MIENGHRPHVKKGGIKYTKGYARKMFFRKFVSVLIILALISMVAGAIYVYVKQPVKTSTGYITVNPIYETIEHGERVFVVKDGNYNLFTPIKRALVTQEVYRARVVAGPYGQIAKAKDKVRVTDGVNVISVNLDKHKKFLDKEYIARKIDDSDEPISNELDIIVSKDQILGGVEKVTNNK